MQIVIVGAGMAGLLAANMLAHRHPLVQEAQPSLPNNHSAVLRFRTSIVGDVLGIPFNRVHMVKTVLPWKNPVADALAYSFKNGGEFRTDRSITAGTVSEERFIAPPDLINRMAARRLTIKYNWPFSGLQTADVSPPAFISTIPMPALMDALEYPHKPEFHYTSGINVSATIKDCDAYCSLLVPDPAFVFTRISLTGDKLIIECPNNAFGEAFGVDETVVTMLACRQLFGNAKPELENITQSAQAYAKIMPIDEGVRRDFLHWATDRYNIFSLGRFATWRPRLLLDDLVKDIRLISGWIGDRYSMSLSRNK